MLATSNLGVPTAREFLVLALVVAALMAAGIGTVLAQGLRPAAPVARGEVIVFEHELTAVTVHEDPGQCIKLPLTAHILVNMTDRPIRTFADPLCATPGFVVAPRNGSHVAFGSGSFAPAG